MSEQESTENVSDDTCPSGSIRFSSLKSLDKEIIKKYESLPELWDVKHHNYNNKYIRHEALQEILKIVKKYDSDVTVYDVRKKINSMRSNYRKVLRKHLLSKKTGPDGEECYTFIPNNWKFYALRFLGGELEDIKKAAPVAKKNKRLSEDDAVESDSEDSEDGVSSNEEDISHTSYKSNSPTQQNIKRAKVEPFTEYINIEGISQKELKAIAANIVYKLQRMSNEQRCHAELLINKVLLHGIRNNLTYNTDLTEVDVLHT